jgi:hypothetical protein
MTRGPIVLAIKHEKETKMADSPFQITCLARDYFQVINGGAVFAIRREPAAPKVMLCSYGGRVHGPDSPIRWQNIPIGIRRAARRHFNRPGEQRVA